MIYNKEGIDPYLKEAIRDDFNKSSSVKHISHKYSITHNETLSKVNEGVRGFKHDMGNIVQAIYLWMKLWILFVVEMLIGILFLVR